MRFLLTTLCGAAFLACAGSSSIAQGKPTMTRQPFGKTADGQVVDLYAITNSKGVEVRITDYGGTVVSLKVPDRNGVLADVVLGFDRLEDYLKGHPFFGCLVGRYANRIAKGRFTLEGKTYTLAVNNGPNHLHGGLMGFDKRVWKASEVSRGGAPALRLEYVSKHMEEGYPGNLTVEVIYSLSDANALRIDYTATTDGPTVVNLTNHSYFNLAGAGAGDMLGHEVQVNADRFVPVGSDLIPTGELRSVAGTPLDFRQPTAIGARIDADHEQIRYGQGYDHTFVLNNPGREPGLAARVREPRSGRVLEVLTTKPGVQLYTGNFLDGSNVGKSGKVYGRRYGFCLETQYFPDSPNQPSFPSPVLRPGETYRHTTVYRFSTR